MRYCLFLKSTCDIRTPLVKGPISRHVLLPGARKEGGGRMGGGGGGGWGGREKRDTEVL